jgi:hypothetical protein
VNILILQKTTQEVFFTKYSTYNFSKNVCSLMNAIFGLYVIGYKNGYFIYNTFSVDFITPAPPLPPLIEFMSYIIFMVWLMVLSATFNYILQVYRGGKLYWWRKPEYPNRRKQPICRKSPTKFIT